MGDKKLLKRCKTFAETHQHVPMIFIFDNDNRKIVNDVMPQDGQYKNWGNNVYSFVIPVPSHREGQENISIEMYYTDEEITTADGNNRRLFLSSEFSATSGTHKEDSTIHLGYKMKGYESQSKAKIIDCEVYRDDDSIALSKNDFADNIFNGISPFDVFDFEEFHKVFNIIDEILQHNLPEVDLYGIDEYQPGEDITPLEFQEVASGILNSLRCALYMFVATTVRCYEDAIVDETGRDKSKARSIKDILTFEFRRPSLTHLQDLTEKCYYLIEDSAPAQLIAMRECLGALEQYDALADALNDIQEITPIKSGDVRRIFRPGTKGSLIQHILPILAEYESELNALSRKVDNRGQFKLDLVQWNAALWTLIERLRPILSLEHSFAHKTVETFDRSNSAYTVRVSQYQDKVKKVIRETVDEESLEGLKGNYSELAFLGDDDRLLRIDLSPFLLIKDDRLYFYKRTIAKGYEYQTIFGNQVTVEDTKTKFNHSVFKVGLRGDQQALFWTDVTPTKNPESGVKSNIPLDAERFVGRKKQIKDVFNNIIEIPNQNGLIWGVGGVGKTALVREVSQQLVCKIDYEEPIFDNIIWVSAKSDYYNYARNTIEPREKHFDTLDNIFTVMLRFFDYDDAEEYYFEDKKELVLELLELHKALLVLDNFETVKPGEVKKILRFFDTKVKRRLRKKPDYFKVIVTSRVLIPTGFHQINLKGLDPDESKRLMNIMLEQYQGVNASLSDEQQQALHEASRGIPIIIKHCFGQLFEFNKPFDAVIRGLNTTPNEVVKFSFDEILKLLSHDECNLEVIILLESINSPLMSRQIADILGREIFEIEEVISDLLNFQCVVRMNQGRDEKYLLNEDIHFFVRGLVKDHTDTSRQIVSVIRFSPLVK